MIEKTYLCCLNRAQGSPQFHGYKSFGKHGYTKRQLPHYEQVKHSLKKSVMN